MRRQVDKAGGHHSGQSQKCMVQAGESILEGTQPSREAGDAARHRHKMERTYIIPLRKAYNNAPSYKRTPKAVSAIRIFLERHMKSTDIRLGQHLNTFLWKHGIKNPPARVQVTVTKDDDGVVKAELAGKEFKETVKAEQKQEEGGLKEKLLGSMGQKPEKEEPEKPAEATDSKKQKPAEATETEKQAS